ncbi:expressed unknown protein [Seminavis robusta]|uniref:Uncharacterized protein n=1 Tax=Seminavis robusta TaxID=568900 RepID=A0A9N8D442_9STRA|nr:expressed unknown protein [Seminavis robusta]|eukprot:Sro1_g000310.1 n/a (208) ;mRNA; r:92611-93234
MSAVGGMETVVVAIPEGVEPGQQIQVEVPGTQDSLIVTVPPNIIAGQQLHVQVPAPPPIPPPVVVTDAQWISTLPAGSPSEDIAADSGKTKKKRKKPKASSSSPPSKDVKTRVSVSANPMPSAPPQEEDTVAHGPGLTVAHTSSTITINSQPASPNRSSATSTAATSPEVTTSTAKVIVKWAPSNRRVSKGKEEDLGAPIPVYIDKQ